MLQLIAYLPVFTLNGTKQERQLYWDLVSHQSMANIASKAEKQFPLILKEYPGAISGMTENHTPISKLDAYVFPIQSIVVNDASFMENLCNTINHIIQSEDDHTIETIVEKSKGQYQREYFGDRIYPKVDISANDISEEYRSIAFDGESIIIHRMIDYGHGVILRSDSLHPCSVCSDENESTIEESENDRFITQISLLVKKDAPLLAEYSIERIQTELVQFFSKVIAWEYEHLIFQSMETPTGEAFYPIETAPFSILKIKALSQIFPSR